MKFCTSGGSWMTCDPPSPCVHTSERPSIHPPQKKFFFWYRCFYPHRLRDLVSPVCRIFVKQQKFPQNLIFSKKIIVTDKIWSHIFWSTFLLVKTIHLNKKSCFGRHLLSRPMRIVGQSAKTTKSAKTAKKCKNR